MAGTDRRKRVLIPIAAGSDEFEMACLRTILWEFGAEVVLARVLAPSSLASSTKSSNFVVMHQGTKVQWDITIEEAATYKWDVVILPGGIRGAEVFRYSPSLHAILLSHCRKRRLCGAIGFSPVVLACLKQLEPAGHTHHPSKNKDEVMQGIFVTATGPESAQTFALQLGSKLYGNDVAQEVADRVMPNRYFRLDISEPSPPTEPVVAQCSTHTHKPRKQIITEHREEVHILDAGNTSEQEKLADKPSTSEEQDHVTEVETMTDAPSTTVGIEEDNINEGEIMVDAQSTTVNIDEYNINEQERIIDLPSTTVDMEEDNVAEVERMKDASSTTLDIVEEDTNEHETVIDTPSTTVNIDEDSINEQEKIIDVPSTTVDMEEDNVAEVERTTDASSTTLDIVEENANEHETVIDTPSTTVNIDEDNINEQEKMKDVPSTTVDIEEDNVGESEIMTDTPSTTLDMAEENTNEHERVIDKPSTTGNIEKDNGIECEKCLDDPSKMIDTQSVIVNIEEHDTTELEKITDVPSISVNLEGDHVTEKEIMVDGTSEPTSLGKNVVIEKKNRIDIAISLKTSPMHYDDGGESSASQPLITTEMMIQRKTEQESSDTQTSEIARIIRIDEEKSHRDTSLNTLPKPISFREETKCNYVHSSMMDTKNEPSITPLPRSVGSACEQVESIREAMMTMKTPFLKIRSTIERHQISNKRERIQKKPLSKSSGKVYEDVETAASPPKKARVKHEEQKKVPSDLGRKQHFKLLLWAKLETIGWKKKLISGNHALFLPPGVDSSNPESKHRIDYFDSYLQIIKFLRKKEKDGEGKVLEQWEDLIALCDEKLKELERLKKLPRTRVIEFVAGEVIAERSEFVDWKILQQNVLASSHKNH